VRRLAVPSLITAVIAAAWSAIAHPWGWLFAIGVHPYPAGTPWTYQLLSGFVASMAVLSVLAALYGWYRSANCKWERCPRIGHFKDSRGVPWCWKHHPDHEGQKPTGAFLHRLHHENMAKTGT
jgi:hypothetical protein